MFFIRNTKKQAASVLGAGVEMQVKFHEKTGTPRENKGQGEIWRNIHENFTEKLQIMLAFSNPIGYII